MIHYLDKQKGFSILELLMALAIGIILLLALANVYFTANNISKQQSVTAQLDETSRQVYRRLAYDLSRAGYVDLMDTPAVLGNAMTGIGPVNLQAGQTYGQALLDFRNINRIYAKAQNKLGIGAATPIPNDQYSAIGFISNGVMQPLEGCGVAFPTNFNPCIVNDSNQQGIRIAYQATNVSANSLRSLRTANEQDSDGTGIAIAGGALDCRGSAIPVIANGFVINQYSVSNGQFRCIGNGGGNIQPIVAGVEEMRFRYLITGQSVPDAVANDALGGLYVEDKLTTSQMMNRSASNSFAWAGVVGVEVCLIVAGEPIDGSNINELRAVQNNLRPTCAKNADGTFQANVAIANADNRLFRRSVRTFAVPNSINITSR